MDKVRYVDTVVTRCRGPRGRDIRRWKRTAARRDAKWAAGQSSLSLLLFGCGVYCARPFLFYFFYTN
jgi:hypothetical protein